MFKIVGERIAPFITRVTYFPDNDKVLPSDLPEYLKEVNHSPTGFEWGYGGSGPAQLSYAILRTFFSKIHGVTEAQRLARIYYQDFKWDVVAQFQKDGFEITYNYIVLWFKTHLTSDAFHAIIENRKE